MEIWKDIEDYPGYQVSNLGRVRTYNKITFTEKHGERHWQDRILKQKLTKFNMYRVELWNDKGHKTISVHRLVAVAFLGKPSDEKMTVNHKDGNRKNNCVENLEWLSLADNIRHGFHNGFFSSAKPIILIDGSGNEYSFYSKSEACRFLNRSNSYITIQIKNNRIIKNSDGDIFYFKEVLYG